MKKVLVIILSMFSLTSIAACDMVNYYAVQVEDNFEILVEELEPSYKAGSIVGVKLAFLSGVRVGVLVDGEEVRSKEVVGLEYELFEFTMPSNEILVQITWNDLIQK